jgi:hypothetical protein
MDPTKEQRQILCDDYTSIHGRKHEPYMKSKLTETEKKARQVKSKVKSMHIIFSDITGIVNKEFVLVGQAVNSAYYCDVLWRLREHVRRLHPELWRQKNWLLHHGNAPSHTSFFTREFLTKINMTVVPTHTHFTD